MAAASVTRTSSSARLRSAVVALRSPGVSLMGRMLSGEALVEDQYASATGQRFTQTYS